MTTVRVLEVYAAEDVRQPNPAIPDDKGEVIEGFYVQTFLEDDGQFVEDSSMPAGCSTDIGEAMEIARQEIECQPVDKVVFADLETGGQA